MTILAAVGEEGPSDRIVAAAMDLATAFDDTLAVLHVIPSSDADEHLTAMREIPGFEDSSISDEMVRAERFAETVVENALDGVDRERVTTVGRIGDPTESVLSAADDLDARYVVIGGRKRSPAGKAVFGSATQSILLGSNRPVVTVMTE